MDNGGCPSHGWSIISSASTNSQLAGLLAGFVFSGIILLFARRGPRDTQTLSLFCAAFVVLGFDSYLFSLVTGGDADPQCAKVWSEGLVASGMLAVGAVAVLSGICWLLAAHVDEARAENATGGDIGPELVNLDRLTRLMVHGVIIGVALLLAQTSRDHLSIVYKDDAPAWLEWSVLAIPLAVSVAALLLVAQRGRRNRRRGAAGTHEHRRTVSLWVVAFGTLVYGVVAPVFVGVLITLPDHWWNAPSPAITAVTLAGGLVVPGLLLVALVLAVPPLALGTTAPSDPVAEAVSDIDDSNVQTAPPAQREPEPGEAPGNLVDSSRER